MVEVFFRSLPRTICLVLSALPADTEMVPQEGAILAPLSGKFTIKLAGKNVTDPDNLNGVSFRAVGDGTRWVLEELHDNGQSVSPDVVRNVAIGDTDSPRLILASKITLRKLPGAADEVVSTGAFAHVARWTGRLPSFGEGQSRFIIGWGDKAPYLRVSWASRARFIERDGVLELELGRLKDSNSEWIDLKAPSGHALRMRSYFRPSFRFHGDGGTSLVCRFPQPMGNSYLRNPDSQDAAVSLYDPARRSSMRLSLRVLEFTHGWARAQFFPGSLVLQVNSLAGRSAAVLSRVSGAAEEFSALFAFDGTYQGGIQSQRVVSQVVLVHANPQAESDSDPYTGLELRGLWDRRGAPLRLASGCVAAVSDKVTDERSARDVGWRFAAGPDADAVLPQDMPAGWRPAAGRLWIRPSSPGGERHAQVVAGDTAFLDLQQDAPDDIAVQLAWANRRWAGAVNLPLAQLAAAPLDLMAEQPDRTGLAYAYWSLAQNGAVPAFPVGATGVELPANLFDRLSVAQQPQYDVAHNGSLRVDLSDTRLTVTAEGRLSGYEGARIALYDRSEAPGTVDPSMLVLAERKNWTISPRDIYVLQDGTPQAAFYPNAGIGRLRYVASAAQLGADFAAEAERLTLSCLRPPTTEEKINMVTVEILRGFGIALARWDNGELRFWDTLSDKHKPVAMVDLSVFDDDTAPGDALGYDANTWRALKAKLEFAFGSGALDEALTPLDPKFQGHVFRDVKLNFPGSAADAVTKYPALNNLYRSLEDWPTIELAWHDARGWTVFTDFADGERTLLHLEGIVTLSVTRFDLVIHAGKLLAAKAGIKVLLPFLKDDVTNGPAQYTLDGQFRYGQEKLLFNGVEIGAGGPLKTFKFNDNEALLESIDIDKIGTDLKTLTIKGQLKFAKAFTLLEGYDGQLPVTLVLPLAEGAPARIEFKLDEPVSATARGWGLSLTSLAIEFDGDKPVKTKLGGTLSLGMDGFMAVAFTVTISGGDAVLTITGFEGQIGIGDFTARLDLGLTDDSEFHGQLFLKSALTGDALQLTARIFNTAGPTSWIAVLGGVNEDTPASTATGEIKGSHFLLGDAMLALGRRVSIKGDGSLQQALSDPTATSVIKAIDEKRLKIWQADPRTDLVVGAAGKLGLDKTWFAAGDKPTGIMLTTGGLFRISAHSRFLRALPVDYDLTLDMRKKFIFAGFQLPSTDPLGDVEEPAFAANSSFTVSGGYAGVGVSYGKKPAFGLTIGWPYASLLDPDIGAPDWSRAVTVYWREAFPINTFQGGALFYAGDGNVTLGIALRAGWTWRYKAEAWKLEAAASLGIMVGGMLHATIPTNGLIFKTGDLMARIGQLDPVSLAPERSDTNSLLAVRMLDQLDDMLAALGDASKVTIASGLYLDAWGSAHVKFFGVTLAGVRIDAHAQVVIKAEDTTVTRAYAKAKFSVRVKIGCTTHKATAYFQIDFVKRAGSLTALQMATPPDVLALPALTAAQRISA